MNLEARLNRPAEDRAQASGPCREGIMPCLSVVRMLLSSVTVEPEHRTFPMGKENLGQTGPATRRLPRRRTLTGAVLVMATASSGKGTDRTRNRADLPRGRIDAETPTPTETGTGRDHEESSSTAR